MGCAFNYERLELVELDLQAYEYQKIMHKNMRQALVIPYILVQSIQL